MPRCTRNLAVHVTNSPDNLGMLLPIYPSTSSLNILNQHNVLTIAR